MEPTTKQPPPSAGPAPRPRPRITLIHAPEDFYDQNYGTQFIPLWAYCLAAYLPPHWEVRIVDCKNEDPRRCERADIFAFSGINQDARSIKNVWSLLKRKYPDATFIVGGPITWSFEEEGVLSELDYFDHIFILDGEESLPAFLRSFEEGTPGGVPKVIRTRRFPITQSRKLRFDLFRRNFKKYYGGVVEVSRGCPFLCEFCDIRVLPDNNQANNKPVRLIVEELDEYYRLGITKIQFACDNFIGDPAWARKCLDAILAWKERTGAEISIFTWLTINLYKFPDIMEKMRRAGFSVLFIGIESVNRNSLLETAKIQNLGALEAAVTTIHSYGFVIAPGFIFGFDSDKPTVFDDTLQFMVQTGIIGGDPSFLMALPGTPLYERMERTGRLVRDEEGVVRMKIQTNIRYLLDSGSLVRGFMGFIERYTDPTFQLARFRSLLEIVAKSGTYIPTTSGYGSPGPYLRLQLRYPRYLKMLLRRIWFFLRRPANLAAVVRAYWLMRGRERHRKGLWTHFSYWAYAWTNIALKYEGLKAADFALHSVDGDFDVAKLLPSALTEQAKTLALRDGVKVDAQKRYTDRALRMLVQEKRGREQAATPGGPIRLTASES